LGGGGGLNFDGDNMNDLTTKANTKTSIEKAKTAELKRKKLEGSLIPKDLILGALKEFKIYTFTLALCALRK